jgi:hypothetical protein
MSYRETQRHHRHPSVNFGPELIRSLPGKREDERKTQSGLSTEPTSSFGELQKVLGHDSRQGVVTRITRVGTAVADTCHGKSVG